MTSKSAGGSFFPCSTLEITHSGFTMHPRQAFLPERCSSFSILEAARRSATTCVTDRLAQPYETIPPFSCTRRVSSDEDEKRQNDIRTIPSGRQASLPKVSDDVAYDVDPAS